MRLVTFVPPDGAHRTGVLLGDGLIDLASAAPLVIEEAEALTWDLRSLLCAEREIGLDTVEAIVGAVVQMLGDALPIGDEDDTSPVFEGSLSIGGAAMVYPLRQVRLLAPLPRPASLRMYQSFEEHAIAITSLHGLSLPAEWYRGPSFVFANHGAIYGPEADVPVPAYEAIDYGLGFGCVIGRTARDLLPEEAHEVIAGYLIVNAWAARDYEEHERALGSGPAKSRDFATSLGPWLVTPNELEVYSDDDGRMSLLMIARVNGEERSRTTTATQYYPFAELIAHASRDATLYPGDVIGSGVPGSGTLLEQTGGYGPWLVRGDLVECEVTGLGTLRNTIV